MTDDDSTLEATDHPLRPKIDVDVDQIAQPRSVEWGHLSQLRGELADDRVRVERQRRRHHFNHGTEERGPALPLFEGPLGHAVAVYRALDALLDGGHQETDSLEADPTLEDALDGLNAAVRYCEAAGLEELASEASALYQAVGEQAPLADWEDG